MYDLHSLADTWEECKEFAPPHSTRRLVIDLAIETLGDLISHVDDKRQEEERFNAIGGRGINE